LDKCECDTDDEVVHCHNGERTQLALPAGESAWYLLLIFVSVELFVQLTLIILQRNPNVIDVERNPNFNCSSLSQYNEVKIISDCYKNISEIARVPRIFRPTRDCDFSCQAEKHYQALHKYVLHLWSILKQKYENFNLDDTLRELQEFFRMVANRVNQMGTKIQPEAELTPMPELQEVNGN
uniref:Interleukin-6 n=1 Tax=Haemonchus placei TaxID=6290 RepID=A0A158QL32_HAEPC